MQRSRGPWALHWPRLLWLGRGRTISNQTTLPEPRTAASKLAPHKARRRRRELLWPRQRPVRSPDLGESGRQAVRLYALSDLVLDLDAEDCKNVRSFDSSIDGKPEEPFQRRLREQASVKRRVTLFELDHKRDEYSYRALCKDHFSPWRITDVDILSTVLEGVGPRGPDPAPKELHHLTPKGVLEALCSSNGIHTLAQEDTSKLVPYMLHRQQFVSPQTLATAKLADLQVILDSFGNLWEMQRFFLQLTKTPYGCLLASQLGHRLSQILRQWATRASTGEVADMLAFSNNVTHTLASRGIQADPSFTGLGLALALKCAAFPAARMYLANGIESGQWGVSEIQPDLDSSLLQLLWLLSSHHRYTYGSDLEKRQQIQAARLAAYGLLTGYYVGGQLTAHCYRSTFPRRPSHAMGHYKHYLHILGELGAFRTLWHEFWAAMRTQKGANNPHWPRAMLAQHWFLSAILRAVRNFRRGRIHLDDTSLAEASGDYATDCELDLRTIMFSSESTNLPGDDCSVKTEAGHVLDDSGPDRLAGLYGFEAQPTDGALGAAVQDFLRQQNIQQAMASLRCIFPPLGPPP